VHGTVYVREGLGTGVGGGGDSGTARGWGGVGGLLGTLYGCYGGVRSLEEGEGRTRGMFRGGVFISIFGLATGHWV